MRKNIVLLAAALVTAGLSGVLSLGTVFIAEKGEEQEVHMG